MDQAPLLPGSTATGERDRLMTAFAQLTAEYGVRNTTVDVVTKTAGVREKAFYTHFADLEDCFIATYEHGWDVMFGKLRAAFEAEPVWRDGLRAVLHTMLTELAAAPDFARLAMVESASVGPRLLEIRTRIIERCLRAFADPAVSCESPEIPWAVVGGIYNVIANHVETGRIEDLPGLAPELTYFTLLPFTDPRDAASELAGGTP
jgi:AcrR family transcriptional regulator